MTSGAAPLEVRGLTVSFARDRPPAVSDVGFAVMPGQILGLVGPAGSGKSTTARAIMGYLPRGARIEGSVKVGGQEILGRGENALRRYRGAQLAMVSQNADRALNPTMRIGKQLIEALRAQARLAARVSRSRALELLAMMAFDDPKRAFDCYPHELSGGMRQRALIGIAVANNPRVLIADEATTALDADAQLRMLRLLASLRDDLTMSVVLISHDARLIADFADGVVVLEHGRVSNAAQPNQSVPASPETQLRIPSQLRRRRSSESTPRQVPALVELVDIGHVFSPSRRDTPTHTALAHVSLKLHRGETVTLLGASGAGKTTLARSIVFSPRPTSGRVLVDGIDLSSLDRRGLQTRLQTIQFVLQSRTASLDPTWKVSALVGEALRARRGGTLLERRRRVGEVLDWVGLSESDFGRHRPGELSGGQLQLVALARALAPSPELLICDEPVSALDAQSQQRVLDLLGRLQRDDQLSCLFITHDLAIAKQISDRVAVLHRGQLCELGAADDVTYLKTGGSCAC